MVDLVSNTKPHHEMDGLFIRRKRPQAIRRRMQVDLDNLLEIIKFLRSMPSGPLKYMFFASFGM